MILGIRISFERTILVAEQFLNLLVNTYGKCDVSKDGRTWYPYACKFLKIKHHLHLPSEKSLIERVMQYFNDRTENFDDYYPCIINKKKKNCDLSHVYNWIRLFIYLYNTTIEIKFHILNGVK
jgi:putative transposase